MHLKVIMTTTSIKATGDAQFWIVPSLLILIVVLVLIALFVWWRRRRRKRLADQEPPEDAQEKADSVPSEGEPAAVS